MSDINPLKPEFSFDFRGVLTAPAKAFELKKIFIGGLALLAALAVYDFFTYLVLWNDGLSPSYVFARQGFFPFDGIRLTSKVSRAGYYLGIASSLFIVALGFLAIGLINVEELRGNRLCSARDGIRFALARARQAASGWITIVVFLLFLAALLAALGVLPRIPLIGAVLFAILLVIPGFLLALVFTFVLYVFLSSFFVLPVATAADKIGETFTSLLETFSTVMRRPFHWIGYSMYGFLSAKICSWILAVFSVYALKSLLTFGRFLGGDALSQTFSDGAGLLPFKSALVTFTTNLWPGWSDIAGVSLPVDISDWGRGGDATIAGILIAIGLALIFAYVWGYIVSVVATTQTYAYVVIRKLRDDYDITTEDPMFIEREWVNPLIEESLKEQESSAGGEGQSQTGE